MKDKILVKTKKAADFSVRDLMALRSESEIRGTLRFLPQLEMRPSSNAPNPVESREAPPTSSFPDFSCGIKYHTVPKNAIWERVV